MKFPEIEHIWVPLGVALLMTLIQGMGVQESSTECLGIQPYHFSGLKGILLAPLLHADWGHLIGNVFPLMALLFLSFQFYGKITYWVFILGWLAVGLLVWIFPYAIHNNYSNTCHIGASGLVYVMAFFLMFSGIFNKTRVLISLSLLIIVGFGSMVWGVFPEEFFGIKDSQVSWQSHLSGALVGIAMSFLFRNKTVVEDKKYDWEGQKDLSVRDQALWDEYQAILKQQEQEEEMEKFWKDHPHLLKPDQEKPHYYPPSNQNSTQ